MSILRGQVVQCIVCMIDSMMTNLLTVVAKVFLNTLIFKYRKNVKSYPHFSAKIINVSTIFQDRNFNIMLADNFVKF